LQHRPQLHPVLLRLIDFQFLGMRMEDFFPSRL
jgi:hypothetical protein